jgi:hypothetical protein
MTSHIEILLSLRQKIRARIPRVSRSLAEVMRRNTTPNLSSTPPAKNANNPCSANPKGACDGYGDTVAYVSTNPRSHMRVPQKNVWAISKDPQACIDSATRTAMPKRMVMIVRINIPKRL